MNNYKVLFSLKLLKSILSTFVDSFLVLYFLELSDSNILPLLPLQCHLTENNYKLKNKILLLIHTKYPLDGIILDFVYFLSIILLKEKVVDYIYLVGILYGLEEGFYFSVYNCFQSDGIEEEEVAK